MGVQNGPVSRLYLPALRGRDGLSHRASWLDDLGNNGGDVSTEGLDEYGVVYSLAIVAECAGVDGESQVEPWEYSYVVFIHGK